MSDGIKDAIADFAAFSLEIDRVRCVLMRSFLVRNWCGGVASWTMHRWQEQTARRIEPMTLHRAYRSDTYFSTRFATWTSF